MWISRCVCLCDARSVEFSWCTHLLLWRHSSYHSPTLACRGIRKHRNFGSGFRRLLLYVPTRSRRVCVRVICFISSHLQITAPNARSKKWQTPSSGGSHVLGRLDSSLSFELFPRSLGWSSSVRAANLRRSVFQEFGLLMCEASESGCGSSSCPQS